MFHLRNLIIIEKVYSEVALGGKRWTRKVYTTNKWGTRFICFDISFCIHYIFGRWHSGPGSFLYLNHLVFSVHFSCIAVQNTVISFNSIWQTLMIFQWKMSWSILHPLLLLVDRKPFVKQIENGWLTGISDFFCHYQIYMQKYICFFTQASSCLQSNTLTQFIRSSAEYIRFFQKIIHSEC